MATTTFVDQATPIVAAWLNDVNSVVYGAVGASGTIPATPLAFLENLGIVVSLFAFLTPAQIADATSGSLPVVDTTTAIQAAITACAGRTLYIPDGVKLKISAALTVTNYLTIKANRYTTTIYLATQNQNGIVVGNNTSGGFTTSSKTIIDGLGFNVYPGVTAFTSGACIYRNYTSYCHVKNCDFYGYDSSTSTDKLWSGVTDYSSILCNMFECNFSYLVSTAVYVYGASGQPASTNRYDNCMFNNLTSDAIYFGTYTEGMTVNQLISYSVQGWAIQVDSTAGTNGQNYFINQPDIEMDGTGGGIYVQSGQRVQIVGGWIGSGTPSAGVPTAVSFAASSNTCSANSVGITGSAISIAGPANTLSGCEISGDNATTVTGVAVASTATDTIIQDCRIRQFTSYGITFTGTPTRCLVSGVMFRNIATAEITGLTASLTNIGVNVRACQTDESTSLTAASTLTLNPGHDFIQVTGATAITAMTSLGPGYQLSVQAGSGGLSWTNGTNLIMKGSTNLAQTQFTVITFVSDGVSWFQTGQNF